MPSIGAIRALHFNPEKVPLEKTIVRLESLIAFTLNRKKVPEDHPLIKLSRAAINRTGDARRVIEDWQRRGFLLKERSPRIYVYHQAFEIDGVRHVRRGWIGACHLEPFGEGKVFPHESTFLHGTEGHLDFLRDVKVNMSPVLVLYSDPEKRIDSLLDEETKRAPLISVKDEMGSQHNIWPIHSKRTVRLLCEAFLDRTLVIADGHHRYEASLRYRDEMVDKVGISTGREAFLFQLMAFSNVFDDGIVILPTHRLVFPSSRPDWSPFYQGISKGFRIRRIPVEHGLKTLVTMGEHSFGLFRGGDHLELITLKSEEFLDEIDMTASRRHRRLDVVILHELFFEKLLKIGERDTIHYVRDAKEAIREVRKSKKESFLFLLNSPSPFEVFERAKAGEKMPPKSTDFFPKLVAGLLMMDVSRRSQVFTPRSRGGTFLW